MTSAEEQIHRQPPDRGGPESSGQSSPDPGPDPGPGPVTAVESGPEIGWGEERRWDGTPGRLEVWYDTFTDPASGTGFWLHHEIVAPPRARRRPPSRARHDPQAPQAPKAPKAPKAPQAPKAPKAPQAESRGWAAVFPVDGPPVWERFAPAPAGDEPWFSTDQVRLAPGARQGRAGEIEWDLRYRDAAPPLFTFPALAWRRQLLPSCQVVPAPTAAFSGTIRCGGRTYRLNGAPGAAARTYGHANASRWAWLHADLGGGDVLEVVAATARRPGLERLAPWPVLRLRTAGRDWPAHPLLAGLRSRAELGLPGWTVAVRAGHTRLRVRVDMPAERCVEVPYTDPDGASATCTNTERAVADVALDRRTRSGSGSGGWGWGWGWGWATERRWHLDGTAHAEVGTRP